MKQMIRSIPLALTLTSLLLCAAVGCGLDEGSSANANWEALEDSDTPRAQGKQGQGTFFFPGAACSTPDCKRLPTLLVGSAVDVDVHLEGLNERDYSMLDAEVSPPEMAQVSTHHNCVCVRPPNDSQRHRIRTISEGGISCEGGEQRSCHPSVQLRILNVGEFELRVRLGDSSTQQEQLQLRAQAATRAEIIVPPEHRSSQGAALQLQVDQLVFLQARFYDAGNKVMAAAHTQDACHNFGPQAPCITWQIEDPQLAGFLLDLDRTEATAIDRLRPWLMGRAPGETTVRLRAAGIDQRIALRVE